MILQKMPFLRLRHDGTLVSPETLDSTSRSVRPSLRSTFPGSAKLRPLLALSCALATGSFAAESLSVAQAAPKPVAVRAWTSGSQTSIRTRPTQNAPVVARVDRHFPITIWGKRDGWYRVETHDAIVGWVHHPYLKSPQINRVRTLSAHQVKVAAKRTDAQIMFGSEQQLRSYFAATKAEGARKGLAMMGVYVSSDNRIAARPSEPASRAAGSPTKRAVDPNASRLIQLRQNAMSELPQVVAPPSVAKANAPVVTRVAPAAKTAAKPASKAAPKLTWRQKREQQRAAAAKAKRDALAKRNGLNPKPIAPASVASLPSISESELLEARKAHIEARQNRQSVVAPSTSGEPISPASPARITPSNLQFVPGENGTLVLTIVDEAQTPETLQPILIANAQVKPNAKPAAPVVNRGGSPRDRAVFGSGLATQALSYRGTRYVFGSANPRRGFDCSGLIYYMLRQRGLNPPRTAAGYRNYGSPVAKKDLQKGDLVLFANTYKRGISHIGVYLGNNNFVHAATTRSGVRVDSLSRGYFASKYHSARRVK